MAPRVKSKSRWMLSYFNHAFATGSATRAAIAAPMLWYLENSKPLYSVVCTTIQEAIRVALAAYPVALRTPKGLDFGFK
jgi:hypothetical protein